MVRTACVYDLEHALFFVRRGLYFQAFDRLYKSFQEFLQALFIARRKIETNVCSETTAREAMVRDFRVFFLSDGTTTGGVEGLSRDEVQRASLATMGNNFAQILTVDEMILKIKDAAALR